MGNESTTIAIENLSLLGPVEKIGLAIMIILLMLGMGATLSWADFRHSLRNPKAFIIGILSQFGFMPLIAFSLAIALELPNEVALALIMIGCTPGGTTSNIFSYYARGDLALSISMTTASTFLAVFLMPVSLLLYAPRFTGEELNIPYKNLIMTLFVILIPVIIGMIIHKKSIKVAKILEKIASWTGIALILFLILSYLFKNFQFFVNTKASFYIAGISLGLAGFFFGFIFSKIMKITARQVRTIAMETGIQNTPIPIALIALTFPDDQQNILLQMPVIYAVFIVISSAIIAFIWRKIPLPKQ